MRIDETTSTLGLHLAEAWLRAGTGWPYLVRGPCGVNWELEAAASLLSSSFILPKRPTAAPATTSGKDGWQEEGNGGRKENLFKEKRNDKDQKRNNNHYNKQTITSLCSWQKVILPPTHPTSRLRFRDFLLKRLISDSDLMFGSSLMPASPTNRFRYIQLWTNFFNNNYT